MKQTINRKKYKTKNSQEAQVPSVIDKNVFSNQTENLI
jgi:hypothetical protein